MRVEWRGNEHTNWSSRHGYAPIAIVDHVVAGSGSSCDSWFRSSGNSVSSAHYCVWEDGRITQYVDLKNMAWANGLRNDAISRATASLVKARPNTNPNLYTVSIEHAGHTGKLTPEQFEASVWLHKHIRDEVKRIFDVTIPLTRTHVLGHFEIDPVRKPNCPGPDFPWTDLMNELKGGSPKPTVPNGAYKVKKGDTLYSIAKEFDLSVSTLKSINFLKGDTIHPGDVLKVTKPVANSFVYTVQKGDTLSEIASKFKTTLADIKKLNSIKDVNKLSIGQKLNIPGEKPKTDEPVYHIVKSGDTVSEIAQKYKVTISKIKSLNKLDSKYTIYPGDKLRVK